MASVRKQIVAMGGDSFSAEREGSRLDRRLEVCVASRPTAGVYGVGADGETLTETALPVRLLG